ncbi:MAG: hypothetical protein QOD90_5769 [Mycobacterium sp.]|nr:hypothetical protein [Mycobacterium sp.]
MRSAARGGPSMRSVNGGNDWILTTASDGAGVKVSACRAPRPSIISPTSRGPSMGTGSPPRWPLA